MYRHFLNKNDYLSIITEKALDQLTRGNEDRLVQAEQSAENTVIGYLSENYEIENALSLGKFIADYDNKITYPVGTFFYFEDRICEVIKSINGYKTPGATVYWEPTDRIFDDNDALTHRYSQMFTYQPGDFVYHVGVWYECREANGYDFNNIRIPGITAWVLVEDIEEWTETTYNLWEVVKYEGQYFTLTSQEEYDAFTNPMDSQCWGLIGEYDPLFNQYELSVHEYVVYNGNVYYPSINPNHDDPKVGVNIRHKDPRNYGLVSHMVQLALYELHKRVSPNNVSSVRISDYDHSILWLRDASRLKCDPQIPRKLGKNKLPVTDWQIATFQTSYDPYQNPWQI